MTTAGYYDRYHYRVVEIVWARRRPAFRERRKGTEELEFETWRSNGPAASPRNPKEQRAATATASSPYDDGLKTKNFPESAVQHKNLVALVAYIGGRLEAALLVSELSENESRFPLSS